MAYIILTQRLGWILIDIQLVLLLIVTMLLEQYLLLLKEKYSKEIEPRLVEEMDNLPQNLRGTDISGSLRDAYRHSYTAGMIDSNSW